MGQFCSIISKISIHIQMIFTLFMVRFLKYPSRILRVVLCIQTDGQTDTGILIGAPQGSEHVYGKTYIQECCLGNWNKFPSCQYDFLTSHIDDETETAYKRDRSSDPLTAPRRLSHTLSLQNHNTDKSLFPELTFRTYLQHCGVIINLATRR